MASGIIALYIDNGKECLFPSGVIARGGLDLKCREEVIDGVNVDIIEGNDIQVYKNPNTTNKIMVIGNNNDIILERELSI